MRKKNKEKIIDLTMSVLEFISRVGGATVHSFIDQKSVYRNLETNDLTREKIRRKISDLINSGNIEAIEEQGRRSVRLTRKGKIKLVEKSEKIKLDGKWRLVSFDVPETMKSQRIQFTRGLRKFGYRAVQKSLWISPYVESEEIGLLIDELTLGEYVARFIASATDIEAHLKQLFEDTL